MKRRQVDLAGLFIVIFWNTFLSWAGGQFLVTNTIPSNGAKNIARNANVEFLANQSLRGSTVTSNRFYLYSETKGRYPGDITFNTATNRVTLNPAQDFFPGGQVFAQVTDGILDSGGGSGIQPYTYAWSFYARADIGGGRGRLYDTGQRLGSDPFLSCAIGDFDKDGDLDAIAGVYKSYQAAYEVYQNDGDGRFTRIQRIDTPWADVPINAACGDIDNDGDLDVVFAVQGGCCVFLNDGTGQFTHDGLSDFGSSISRAVALGDMNGDGELDAVVVNYDQNDQVWTNRNGMFYLAQSFNGARRSTSVRLADMDNNGTLDAFISGNNLAHIVFTNNGQGVLNEHMTLSPSYSGASLALGDLNGDGSIDAFCGGDNDYWQVWTNNSAGRFALKAAFGNGWAYSTELGDIDGDGDLDAVLLEHPAGLQIWTNNGTGTFGNTGMPSNLVAGVTFACAKLGDLDGDGDLDVFMACESNCYVYLNELPRLTVLGTNGAAIASGEAAGMAKGTDWGSVVLGNGDSRTLSLTAPNAVGVTITNLTTNGTSAAMFSVEGVADFVASGGQTNFLIRFTPVSLGAHTAVVSIAHNGTNSPSWFHIRGNGSQPRVTNTFPANAAFGQDRAVQPAAQFTQPMNGATLTSNRFFAYSAQSGFKRGAISFDATTNVATLEPSADMQPGELVHAEITRGVMNHLNNAELAHHTWSFYTDVQTGPALFGDSGQRIGTNDTQSAALGDLNNDGWLDVFIANNDKSCEVWTNNRSGVFSRVPIAIGTPNSRFVALGDINRDGDLDAVVVRNGQAAQVFNNIGGAVFTDSGQALSAGNGRHATLADINGDGALDILLLREGETGAVYTNNGTGFFALYAATPSVTASGAGVVDVNGDGFLDAFIANTGGGNQVFTNNGSGALADAGQLLGAADSRDVAMGDFNGDGFFDAFVANDNGQANTVWFNSGTGTFYNSGQSLGAADSRGVATGDFDGDGDLDIFVANYGEPNEIWLNDGSGVFTDSGRRLGSADSCRVQVGDVDGDGRLDAFVANDNGACALWLNPRPHIAVVGTNGLVITNGAVATQAAGTDFGTVEFAQALTHHLSISNPGIVDLVIESITTTSTHQIYFTVEESPSRISSGTASNLTITFQPRVTGISEASLSIVSTATNSPYQVHLRGASTASFLVTNVAPSGEAALAATGGTAVAWLNEAVSAETLTTNRFLMYGAGSGYQNGTLSLSDGNRRAQLDSEDVFFAGEEISAWLTFGVLNQSGLRELRPYAWTWRIAVPAGSARFRNSGQPLANSTNRAAALGDLDGDGDLDVIAGGYGIAACAAWINDGEGNLSKGSEFPGLRYVYDMALGDLDRDGDLDVVFALSTPSVVTNAIWMNDGTGSFSCGDFSYSSTPLRKVALQDLNADGYLDAFLLGNSRCLVWFNDGGTMLDSGQQLGSGGYDVGLADLDGDGDMDAFECKNPGNRVWLNRGDGFFVDSGHTNGTGTSLALALGDVDGDGDMDAYTTTLTNAILWLNNGTGVFTNSGQAFGPDSPDYGVAFGDLDGDGDLDLFCTHSARFNSVLINNGAGVFSEGPQAMSNLNYSVCLGDLDGDGDLDAYATSLNGRDIVWINENPDYTIRGVNGAAITNGETASPAKGTDFGPVSNGTLSAHVLSITNAGPGDLPIGAIFTNGPGAAHFRCADMPTRIPAGTASNFTVVFAPLPSVWGAHEADLMIVNHGAHDTQMVVRLQGIGLAPCVTNTMPPNA
ncbi:MAG: choice-of-anchor D domain-containing protein, partial [Spartobacteria bacterium]|nr:choice-of-anchor D domain-containing protein [Spartobacteria bacterium]